MTRLYRALMAAALVVGAAPAARAAAPPAGELTAVSIVAAPGRVDFVLQVTGNVQVNDAPPQVDYFPYAGGAT